MRIETTAVHAGRKPDPATGAVTPPIQLSTTFERAIMIPVLLVPFAAYFVVDGVLGAPLQVFAADSTRSVISLHAVSVASLTALIGFMFAPVSSEGSA